MVSQKSANERRSKDIVLVIVKNGVDAMCNSEHGASPESLAKRLLYQAVCVSVHLGGCFVQEQHSWSSKKCARQTGQLSLANAAIEKVEGSCKRIFIRPSSLGGPKLPGKNML